jgi:hypothetical protein
METITDLREGPKEDPTKYDPAFLLVISMFRTQGSAQVTAATAQV